MISFFEASHVTLADVNLVLDLPSVGENLAGQFPFPLTLIYHL